MKWLTKLVWILGAVAVFGVARGGHELPIYPSFYPHEIDIRSLAPEEAAPALREGKIQAYIGRGLSLSRAPGAEIRAVESLGSFILVRANPSSPRAQNDACAVAGTVMRALASQDDFVAHPYPVTPFDGLSSEECRGKALCWFRMGFRRRMSSPSRIATGRPNSSPESHLESPRNPSLPADWPNPESASHVLGAVRRDRDDRRSGLERQASDASSWSPERAGPDAANSIRCAAPQAR